MSILKTGNNIHKTNLAFNRMEVEQNLNYIFKLAIENNVPIYFRS